MPRRRPRLDHRTAAAALARTPEATMSDVAAELGMAKPTLYRLAGGREQLLRACVDAEAERLLDHLHAELRESSGASALEAGTAALRAVERFAADSPGGFRLLFARRGPDADAALLRLEARLTELLRRRGAPPDGLELVAAGLLGAAAAVVSRAREAA